MFVGILGLSFALLALAINNQILNAMLVLSPAFVTALYGPLTGQSPGALAFNGSVLDRIKYMVLFGGPFLIGFLGALNQLKYRDKSAKVSNPPLARFFVGLVLFVSVLKIFSILGLKPVEGQGRSIYVPIFASTISVVSILVFAGSLFTIIEVRKAFEVMICGLYLFLLLNGFLQLVTWAPQIQIFQSDQLDGFRFSPFAQILQLHGRQAFFDTDPESFAVYSLLSFTAVINSEYKIVRYLGPLTIFVVGSTTQSRLFYLVITFVVLLNLLIARDGQLSRLFKRGTFLALFFVYYYLLVIYTNRGSNNGIQSFSGRTGIWKIVLEHWSDRGRLLGHQGLYTLEDYSSENAGRLIFFHAHNLILQYLWDWGLIGLLLVLTLCVISFLMSQIFSRSGYLLSISIVMAGIIEITLPDTVLSSKFIFVLLIVKHACSKKEPSKVARPEP